MLGNSCPHGQDVVPPSITEPIKLECETLEQHLKTLNTEEIHRANQIEVDLAPQRQVLSKTKPRLEPILADEYRQSLLEHHNPTAFLEEVNATLPAQLEAARSRAELIADVLLTPTWLRAIGKASKLVRTLMIPVLETREVFEAQAEHCFSTYEDLAKRSGVSRRTIERWLSPMYSGKTWLDCWIQRRAIYGRRNDGLPCIIGTVFRVRTEVCSIEDLTPAFKPRLEAMKAPWRSAEELPSVRTPEEDFVESFDRQKKRVTKTFPTSSECFGSGMIRVEGREISKILTIPLFSNDRQTRREVYRTGLSSALHETALGQAKSLAERLEDKASETFYYTLFRRAALGQFEERQIWAAASEGLQARDAGRLTRGTAGGYLVGVLRNAGLRV